MEYAASVILGYLLGAIPVSVLTARRHGVDLYAVGDGNPGAWNALEQLGMRRAWPAFVGDGCKAALAGAAGLALGGWWTGYAGVAAAMVGHGLPPFARGGKAVMAFVGGAFVLSPAAAGISLAVCGATTAAAGFKWGARAGVFSYPLVQLALDPVQRVAGTGALMCLVGALFLLRRTPGRATHAQA